MNSIEPKEFTLKDGRKGIVRRAGAADAGDLLKLFEAIITHDAYNVTALADFEKTEMTVEKEQKYIEDHQIENSLLLVAQVNNAIVGTAAIENGNRERTAHTGMLHVSVDRRYRQNGVATALLHAALEWAKDSPFIEKVALGVLANHAVAIDLYKKLGFVEEGRKIKEAQLPKSWLIFQAANACLTFRTK